MRKPRPSRARERDYERRIVELWQKLAVYEREHGRLKAIELDAHNWAQRTHEANLRGDRYLKALREIVNKPNA